MKTRFYTYSLFILTFLVLGSCKSQPIVTESKNKTVKQVAIDSVAYKIIKDSVYCKTINDYYPFEFLDVKHPNQTVQDSINHFIIDLDKYTRYDELNEKLGGAYDLKKYINNTCVEQSEISGWDYINTEYEVTINEKHLFGFKYRWIVSGYAHYNIEEYSFNLKTGKELITEEVFKNNTTNLFNDLSLFMLNTVKSDLEDIKNEEEYLSDDDKKHYEEEYSNYIKDKKYLITELPDWHIVTLPEWSGLKEIGQLGIEFRFYKDFGRGYIADLYDSEFYTMKQIEPYLTDYFKTLIGLN